MQHVLVTGAAGLIGQNLIARLKTRADVKITAIDKHRENTATLRALHPDITVIEADLATPGEWAKAFAGVDVLVLNHAQIGGLTQAPFIANNITATRNVLDAAKAAGIGYIVHISSSVVNSMARDFYTETKKEQERLVLESGIDCCVLRPTLMFGWFDRKHIGWLARFMRKVPGVPGSRQRRYKRQPLYAGDFCNVIIAAIDTPRPGEVHDISGREIIDYIDLMRLVKRACGARALIVPIPYALFRALLRAYALVDRDPPFTTHQLKALVTPDVFAVTDWPEQFSVQPTALADALRETFNDPVYSKIELVF